MPDSVLAVYFLALCALAAAWIFTYRAIVARLRALHPKKFSVLFGTPEHRKNGMDRMFSVFGFVFQDQAELRDWRLLLACVVLKALVVLWLLIFIAMMFTPFFLRLSEA